MSRTTATRPCMILGAVCVVFGGLGSAEAQTGKTDDNCSYNGWCLTANNSNSNYYGISSTTTDGIALSGTDNGSGTAIWGISSSGYGVEAVSTSSFGLYATSSSYTALEGLVFSSTYSGVSGVNQGTGYGTSGWATGGHGIHGSDDGGGVGVYGTCSGTGCYAGEFAGNVNITGCLKFNGTTYYGTCSSDRRLKVEIKPLEDALDRLVQLQGVTYKWKDPGGNAPGTQTGFIAQEVERVFPKWVGEDKDGFKTLNIPPWELAALEVEAFKSVTRENESLKTETDMLKERVAALEGGRAPRISGINLNGVGFGVGGIAIGLGLIVSRRRRGDDRTSH